MTSTEELIDLSKPHRVEIGKRYSDDSGWEWLVVLDIHENRLDVDIGDSGAPAMERAEWLIAALKKAVETVGSHT